MYVYRCKLHMPDPWSIWPRREKADQDGLGRYQQQLRHHGETQTPTQVTLVSQRASLEIHFPNKTQPVSFQDPLNAHCLITEQYSSGGACQLALWLKPCSKKRWHCCFAVSTTPPRLSAAGTRLRSSQFTTASQTGVSQHLHRCCRHFLNNFFFKER